MGIGGVDVADHIVIAGLEAQGPGEEGTKDHGPAPKEPLRPSQESSLSQRRDGGAGLALASDLDGEGVVAPEGEPVPGDVFVGVDDDHHAWWRSDVSLDQKASRSPGLKGR